MRIIDTQVRPDGLHLTTSAGQIKITPYAANILRVRYTLEDEFSGNASLSVIAATPQTAEFRVEESDGEITLSTAELTLHIDRDTCAFTYEDRSGNLLTKEPERGGKTLAPVDVIRPVFGDALDAQQGADGLRMRGQVIRQVVDRRAYHAKLEFEWSEGEALYGLGSHEEGMMNLRGQHQYLYQQNMKVVVPALVSTRGYGVLLDTYSLMTFHDDAFGSYLWTEFDEELNYYFVYGPEFDAIVRGLRYLTGQAPMLPRWAFGYIQSKERYQSQAELIEIAQEYRTRKIPLDGIVLDWQSWPGELWGQKSLDPVRFPDPDAMTVDLHSLNARLMISIWPLMRQGGENWREMREAGYLLNDAATYDAFNPQARALYWKQAREGLFDHGIDAWWCDCTEPYEADWNGAIKPEPEERMRVNAGEARTYLDSEYINAYSLLHSAGIYEGQRAADESKRVLNLTRSAYSGQQRYGTITWSGDVCATWETLRRQIPAGLNFCVTGLPYWTTDIGAFFVRSKPDLWFWSGDYEAGSEDFGYRELYVRWFQYAAFLPMFRSHGTDRPREVWRFGQPGEPFYEALLTMLRLRYRLLPYIYSLGASVTLDDYTLLRALAFDFRADLATCDVDDQYMFGPALLVCPVTQSMYYAAGSQPLAGVEKARDVYLPAGCDWFDFWTGQRYSGGQTIRAAAPLDILPLFARSGSILPLLGVDVQHTGEAPGATLDLIIFPGADAQFTFYDDEGDSYAYERGAFATVSLRWDDAGRRLTIGARQGTYPGMSAAHTFRVTVADGQPIYPPQPLLIVADDGAEISVNV